MLIKTQIPKSTYSYESKNPKMKHWNVYVNKLPRDSGHIWRRKGQMTETGLHAYRYVWLPIAKVAPLAPVFN